MTLEIRRLRATEDGALFEQSYSWLMDGPQWRRDTEAVFNDLTREAWLAAAHDPTRIDIGVFIDKVFSADVILTVRGRDVYEVHFEAHRGTPLDAIIEAGRTIRDQMFQHGMQWAYTWTPHWNRAVLAVNKAIGFQPSNVSMWRGTTAGRLIEWVRYEIVR